SASSRLRASSLRPLWASAATASASTATTTAPVVAPIAQGRTRGVRPRLPSAVGATLANAPSRGPQRSAGESPAQRSSMREFPVRDHANCGMDEFSRRTVAAVLQWQRSAVGRAFQHPCRAGAMQSATDYVTMLAVGAVFVVLLAGLWNMMR